VGLGVGDIGHKECDIEKRQKSSKFISRNPDTTVVEAVQSCNLLWYTREQAKREEREIIQPQQHSIYILFV